MVITLTYLIINVIYYLLRLTVFIYYVQIPSGASLEYPTTVIPSPELFLISSTSKYSTSFDPCHVQKMHSFTFQDELSILVPL